jgi:hypothetical protein
VASDDTPRRPNQSVVDYVTIVLSPVLVMGLVGSLVLFLLEVFYKTDGQWKGRLQWILFFYVFGSVLTARVAMNGETASRAPIYGGVLALCTFIGIQMFVEYPEGMRELSFLVNIFLIGIVWWCSQRLTWDCTNVDEDTDMSGEGLLQASGLEEKPAAGNVEENLVEEPEEKKKNEPPMWTWMRRYREYRDRRQKKRTLGVWVVYFSLAALPLFGLGQSFIPLTAPDRRQFAFWLMTVYVGCGLGLLLTTCFLGLRRYLRQKRLQMPAAMTGVWLTTGGTLVVLLLLAGAFLPRPYAEYPLMDVLNPVGSAKRKANQMAVKGDAPGEGKGQPGEARPDGKAPGNKSGKQGEGKGEGKEPGDKSGQSDSKNGKGGDSKGDKNGGEKGEKGEQGKGEQGKGEQDKDEQDKGEQGEKENKSGGSGRKTDPGKMAKGMKDMEKGAKNASSKSSSSSSTAKLQQVFQRIGPVLKWIVFAVLAVVVLLAVLRGGLGFLANFTDWAKRLLAAWKNFWSNLFGGAKVEATVGGEAEEPAPVRKREEPFSAFANPFDTGKAERMPARELVRYTFAAMEAWARERDLGRREDETALEFARRVGEEVPALETESQQLANLHARAEYAREKLPADTAETVQVFWERLERVVEAPMSA